VRDDPQIHGTIEQLVAEEHELWERESAGNASEADGQRLQQVKVSLDQCWDLLRQRRAGGARVADDVDSADLSGVSGTPTFFINGRRHHGAYDIGTFSAAVRAAGARATPVPVTPTERVR
jgi:protein-disulfide isomerase